MHIKIYFIEFKTSGKLAAASYTDNLFYRG